MHRMWMTSALLLVTAASAAAQQPPAAPMQGETVGLSVGIKRGWDGVKINIREAAEKMPEENYSFKPTPDVRSFGELVGHVAASWYGTCARLNGATSQPPESAAAAKATTKAELVKAIQGALAACDAIYSAATDESVMKPFKLGPNTVLPVNIMWYNASHANEHYGNMVTYMRLKGLVPPSTERSQKPRAND